MRLALIGVLLGTLAAPSAGRWVQPLLFQQNARDARLFAMIGALLIVVALAASALPALRAARTDPGSALKAE